MGKNGCGWVRWGTEGTGDTKRRQAGVIWGLAGQDLVSMSGEISPDIMFLGGWQKMVWMGAGTHRAVWMGADGCRGKGGGTKQGEKIPKWASRGCFAMCVHSAKKQEVVSDGHAGQRGSCGGMEGKQEVCGTV